MKIFSEETEILAEWDKTWKERNEWMMVQIMFASRVWRCRGQRD